MIDYWVILLSRFVFQLIEMVNCFVAAGNRTPVFVPIASLTIRPILCQQGTNKAQSNFTFHNSHNKFLDHVTHLSRWPLQGDIVIKTHPQQRIFQSA